MDQSKLRSYLAKIAPEKGRIESFLDRGAEEGAFENVGASPAAKTMEETIRKVEKEEPLSPEHMEFLEAIILPKERPVIDVIGGTYGDLDEPFAHLGLPKPRKVIQKAIPSVGRIELPGHPTLPFGGTGFVVGENLLMTNRHVAALFASGLGAEGVVFQSGRKAGIDFLRERDQDNSIFLEIKRIVMIHPFWDMALLEVSDLGAEQDPLRLTTAEPGDLDDREVVVVGYPALDPRNNIALQNQIFGGVFNVKRLQPGKMGEVARVSSFGHEVKAVTHDCSTLGGNSGSAVVDVETGTVFALHFAGRYLEANFSVPGRMLAMDPRVVDAGVHFDGTLKPGAATEWDKFWVEADPPPVETNKPSVPAGRDEPGQTQTVTVNVPLEITVRLGGQATVSAGVAAGAGAEVEAMVEPFHEEDFANRKGYDPNFLGAPLAMPKLASKAPVSKLDDGSTELLYEHFSAFVNKDRRLAHFLAANVDGSPARTKPEPNRDYSRKGLTGLGPNDQEKWFTDPRIPGIHQLPDKFFTKDRTAFDKGHIIRRTYVAWGDSFDELKRANGDTFHVTNCSPQVAAFNRSNKQGLWGELENIIQGQATAEKYSVFAGPIFRAGDPVFQGRDDQGKTVVRIPQTFWKVIVVRTKGKLQTFAFKLDQDLSGVDFTELAFDADWAARMISIPHLQAAIGTLKFPKALHDSDQAGTSIGESVRGESQLELVVGE